MRQLIERFTTLFDRKPGAGNDTASPGPLPARKFAMLADYLAYRSTEQAEILRRRRFEFALLHGDEPFGVPGTCAYCNAQSTFLVDFKNSTDTVDGVRVPNWRERLICERCQLNNRTRAVLHFLQHVGKSNDVGHGTQLSPRKVLFTEQVTPLFRAASTIFPGLIGSEYLQDGTVNGACNGAGIRHEDITNLSFEDNALDLICTCDVLEHVPDYRSALQECFRCLTASGTLVISVPFMAIHAETLVRARIGDDGTIIHIEPPEYHGDPMNGSGALCYYHFGWDFLEDLRSAGFADVGAYFYWSDRFGYLGDTQLMIVAVKSPSIPISA